MKNLKYKHLDVEHLFCFRYISFDVIQLGIFSIHPDYEKVRERSILILLHFYPVELSFV